MPPRGTRRPARARAPLRGDGRAAAPPRRRTRRCGARRRARRCAAPATGARARLTRDDLSSRSAAPPARRGLRLRSRRADGVARAARPAPARGLSVLRRLGAVALRRPRGGRGAWLRTGGGRGAADPPDQAARGGLQHGDRGRAAGAARAAAGDHARRRGARRRPAGGGAGRRGDAAREGRGARHARHGRFRRLRAGDRGRRPVRGGVRCRAAISPCGSRRRRSTSG